MSLRSRYPAPRVSSSHVFLTVSRGDRARQVALRPWLAYTLTALVPLGMLAFTGASAYIFFHDDMLQAMASRQSDMQFAYEDRLASLRTQLDRVTSRQLLDQDTLEGRVHDLISRQAQIENRTSMIAALADQAGVPRDATSTIPAAAPPDARRPIARTANPLMSGRAALPAGVSAFAPVGPAVSPIGPASRLDDKPRPDFLEQRSDLGASRAKAMQTLADSSLPVDTRLHAVSVSLEGLEISQVHAVARIGGAARRTASLLRTAIADVGLSPDSMSIPGTAKNSAMGGPFVPLKADPKGSLFEREVYRLQNDFVAADKLRRLVPTIPLRQPVPGGLDVTSGFGGRADPFLGRLAVHTGVDLRDPAGSPVRTTAGGRVVSAGWRGGYGNMIEIDHGNGLTTRYAHLQAILVTEDQNVEAGWIIGKLGSTGRSTGPHLHYEVRVNGEPVDPMRFLRSGARLAAL